MFKKILIANRGEIACRVIRTAKRLGIQTVAVYSAADAQALHVRQADEAFYIGPAPSSESYLCGDKIIAIAVRSGAEAIHPGYGFLSENAEFAENCVAAGIVFIGPPSDAIRQMGEKSTAKRLMEAAKVPVIPGYHGESQDLPTLQKAADKIGYPVLIKAIAGGGGKGMRVVHKASEFETALAQARREAKSSFKDDRVLLEKYLAEPRHIEMQVFADSHGHALYLFERDCSIQRRHQKILEEAPAPGMTETLRKAMGKAAVDATQAIGYCGAGTIEFLLDKGDKFYFMEMNTRLQVEHPVTEMILQQDLVEWQLRVAAGEPLPILEQSKLQHIGHAIEARIYAEDPQRDFMPSVGTLVYLKTPAETPHIRIDSGVTQGDSISRYYDPMIAKLITWGVDRQQALGYLTAALAEFEVVGVYTNIPLLNPIAQHPAFAEADFDTHFIEHHPEVLCVSAAITPEIAALAALGVGLQAQRTAQALGSANMQDTFSPWRLADAWQPNLPAKLPLQFKIEAKDYSAVAELEKGQIRHLTLENALFGVKNPIFELQNNAYHLSVSLNDTAFQATLVPVAETLHLFVQGQHYPILLPAANAAAIETENTHHTHAPMPGTLTQIFVNPGQSVKKGDKLLVVEAMKMEHTLFAPLDGKVQDIFYAVGDVIEEGAQLIAWEE